MTSVSGVTVGACRMVGMGMGVSRSLDHVGAVGSGGVPRGKMCAEAHVDSCR